MRGVVLERPCKQRGFREVVIQQEVLLMQVPSAQPRKDNLNFTHTYTHTHTHKDPPPKIEDLQNNIIQLARFHSSSLSPCPYFHTSERPSWEPNAKASLSSPLGRHFC